MHLFWIVLLSMTAAAQAQDDPARIVQLQTQESARLSAEWLRSPEPRIRAWGASVAVRDRVTTAVPRLVSLATDNANRSRGPDGASRDEHESMLSVLDALIQLDGRIPLTAAARLYEEFPAPALIFLSHGEPEADVLLLDIFRKEERAIGAWLTAGNLLMNRKPQGFAALVLGGFIVDVQVRVVDAGGAPERPGGYAGSCSSGAGAPRAGWPPVGTYYVSQRGMLLSQGQVPTSYIRIVGAPEPSGRRADFPCDFVRPNWNLMRERFLARLAGELSGDTPVKSLANETLTWRNDAQYLTDMRALIRRQQDLLDSLATRLLNAGVLTGEEHTTARPSIAVTVTDDRSVRRSQLPALQNAGSRVTVTQ